MRVDWGEVCDCFVWDGSWIDLYAFEVGPAQWSRMFQALEAAGYGLIWSIDGREEFSELHWRPETLGHVADIRLGDAIALSAFFFDPETIEITIDPREIRGPEDFTSLCAAVETIASAIASDIVICPENLPEGAFLYYSHAIDLWTMLPWPRVTH